MDVELVIGDNPQLWHTRLARACENAGFDVAAVAGAGAGEKIAGLDLLLSFERLAYRARDCALERADITVNRAAGAGVAVDVSGAAGAARRRTGVAILRPLYDGSPDPAAAVSALLARRARESPSN